VACSGDRLGGKAFDKKKGCKHFTIKKGARLIVPVIRETRAGKSPEGVCFQHALLGTCLGHPRGKKRQI